jgi:hypothetical protein
VIFSFYLKEDDTDYDEDRDNIWVELAVIVEFPHAQAIQPSASANNVTYPHKISPANIVSVSS